jgi:hypothetical protein
MVLASYSRIKAADPGLTVLLGNIASSGTGKRSRRRPDPAARVLGAMACVNSRYRPTRRGRCRSFRRFPPTRSAITRYQFFLAP